MLKRNILIYTLAGVVMFAIIAAGIYYVLDQISGEGNDLRVVVEVSDTAGGTPIDPPRILTDFTMTSDNGEALQLSDMQGKLVLVYFGYTHCPDACPHTLLDFVRIKRALGEDAEQIAFVMITIDPERDTPELLNRYLERYDPAFIGLTPDAETLENIQTEYNLVYEQRENTGSQAGYLMDHTSSKFLIDREGRLIRLFSFTTDPDVIAAELREML